MNSTEFISTEGPAMEAALKALVDLNSFSGNAAGCTAVAKRIMELAQVEGLEPELVPGNGCGAHLVLRSLGRDDAPPIGLVGHADTVFPPGTFEGYRVDGALRRGPGVFDMKGGIVVMLWALKAVARVKPLRQVPGLRVVIVADEEVGSPDGALVIRRELAGCQSALVFEPGRSNDSIVTERQGTGTVFCTAHGKAAHAGNAYWEGANAIWSLARFIDGAQQLSSKERNVTVNVGTVSGGTSKNTVPAEAVAGLDLRFLTVQHGAELVEQLRQVASRTAMEGTSLEVKVASQRPPMMKTTASEALRAAYGAAAKAHGLSDAEAPRQAGASDGNTTSGMGIATIDALGPRGGGFHTHDEHIVWDTMAPRAAALADFLISR